MLEKHGINRSGIIYVRANNEGKNKNKGIRLSLFRWGKGGNKKLTDLTSEF